MKQPLAITEYEQKAIKKGVATKPMFEMCINPQSHIDRGENDCNGSCQLYTNNVDINDL